MSTNNVVSELLAQTDGSAMDWERLSSCVRDVLLNTPLQQDTEARTQEPTPWKCGNIQLPKFIGYEDRQSPTDFLDKFENFCLVTAVPDSKRVRQVLPAALEGTAKLWWRFAGGFEDWDSFVKEFHAEFASVDYKHRLKEELDRRTQHPQEILRHFIHVIAEFYDRIGETVSDEEKVRRVRRPMHPKFQDLCEGLTFANLREFAKEAGGVMERAWHRLKYVPPPPRTDQVAKDLAFAELHPTVPNQCPPSTLAAVSAGVAPQPWWPLHPAAVQSSYCKDQMWVPTTMPCQPALQLPPQWAVQQPQLWLPHFNPCRSQHHSGQHRSIQPGHHLCHNRVNSGFKLHSRPQTCSLPPTEDKCVNAVVGLDTLPDTAQLADNATSNAATGATNVDICRLTAREMGERRG
ncbi:unnamed protein product [Ixodes pacificus]